MSGIMRPALGLALIALAAFGFGGFAITPAHADNGDGLGVPYWNQYHVPHHGDDCGPTSIAMVAQYYGLWPSNLSARDFISQIRQDGTGSSADGLTNAGQLETAANDVGMSYDDIGDTDAYSAIEFMAGAIGQGEPVVAFIDAHVLGRHYHGHWLVITGFSYDDSTVYANDPDQNPYGGSYSGGQIQIDISTFFDAVQTASDEGYDLGFSLWPTPSDPGNGGEPCGITVCSNQLGGVDLDGYCRSVGFDGVSLDGNTAYDWHCDDWSESRYGINMDAACQWQYSDGNAYAEMGDYNDPNSWQCFD